MENAIKIKCPSCKAVLSVRNTPGIEKKNVTCPLCKKTYPFSEFSRPKVAAPSRSRQPAGEAAWRPAASDSYEDRTRIETTDFKLGQLILVGTGIRYQLKPRMNTVGRKNSSKPANFQIDTGESKLMSRCHLMINVEKDENRGYVHYLSLGKANVNPTTVNGNVLTFGIDSVILHHGDVIELPDATLRFEMPDEDATEIR